MLDFKIRHFLAANVAFTVPSQGLHLLLPLFAAVLPCCSSTRGAGIGSSSSSVASELAPAQLEAKQKGAGRVRCGLRV
jgi:hypothetical protein